jgi:hypothetical protein
MSPMARSLNGRLAAWGRATPARRRALFLVVVALAFAIGAVVATRCAGRSCEAGGTPPREMAISAPAFQPRWDDLAELVNDPRTDLVVQGCVTYASQEGVAYGVAPIGPGYPQGTKYTFWLSEVIVARQARPVSPITIGIQGGVRDGVAHIVEGYPLLRVGQGYILFLHRLPDDTYIPVGPPGYLLVRGGRVEPLVSGQPTVEPLRGATVREFTRRVRDERR